MEIPITRKKGDECSEALVRDAEEIKAAVRDAKKAVVRDAVRPIGWKLDSLHHSKWLNPVYEATRSLLLLRRSHGFTPQG
jgi:hypothetical protein